MRLGRCSRAFVKPRTAVANLMTSTKTLSASIRSSVIGHHLPSSGRPCPARKVPPGTRLLSHSSERGPATHIPPHRQTPLNRSLAGFSFVALHGGKTAAEPMRRRFSRWARNLGGARAWGVRECDGQDRQRFTVVPWSIPSGWMRGAVFRAPRMGARSAATRSGRTRQRVRERRSPPQAPVLREREVLRD